MERVSDDGEIYRRRRRPRRPQRNGRADGAAERDAVSRSTGPHSSDHRLRSRRKYIEHCRSDQTVDEVVDQLCTLTETHFLTCLFGCV